MKLLSTLLPVLLTLASPSFAKLHHNTTSPDSQCHQITALTHLIALASNQTLLSKTTHGNATLASEIQSHASSAASTLAALESNTTLTAFCAQLSVSEAARQSCRKLARLERTAVLAGNETTTSETLKNKAARDAAELASLQGNVTLTTFCAGLKTRETCREMQVLQKIVDKGGNWTGGDSGAKRSGKGVALAEKKLDEFKGNATLVEACSALAGEEANTGAQALTSSSSAAGDYEKFWSAGTTVSFVTVFMSAVLLL